MILRKELWICFGALAFLSALYSGINFKSFQEDKKAKEIENIKQIEYSLTKKIDNLTMDSKIAALAVVESKNSIPVIVNYHDDYEKRNRNALRQINDELIAEYIKKIEKKKKMRTITNTRAKNESL